MTTLGGISFPSSEAANLIAIDGATRNSGIEHKLDLDTIFAYMQNKYKAEDKETPDDGWEDYEEE